ncbi:MAG TPA: metallophosphoesterase, partial [Patescibacteria group bacterium]|nr:metallophosphoesterase [Patescibacteria group bacterium]
MRKFLVIVLLLAAAAHFKVAQALATSFSFAAAGDFGTSSAGDANYNLVKSSNVDFFLAVGDFAYGGSPSSWTTNVKNILGTSFPFQLVAGNHDTYNGPSQWNAYTSALPNKITLPTPPQSVCQYADPDPLNGGSPQCQVYGVQYYFDYPVGAPIARIIGVSPGGNVFNKRYVIGTNTYNWTAAAIDDARTQGIPWVIVSMHEDCITTATKSCSFSSGIEPDLMNLMLAKKVDIILEGHDHTYQRSKQLKCAAVGSYNASCVVASGDTFTKGQGSVVVINGLGGVGQYAINTSDAENGYFQTWSGSNINTSFGISKFVISNNPLQMSTTFIPSSGGFTDSFTISANGIPTPTASPTPTPSSTPTPIATATPTPTPSATPSPTPTRTPTPVPTTIPSPTPTAGPVPGDANGDRLVNESDYSVWVSNYNKTLTGSATVGDFTGNGKVDGFDFVVWRLNYGLTTPAPTPTSTPVTDSTNSFFVGCDGSANDNNSGKSPTSAWASLTKASSSSFTGQNIILERGCTWNGQTLTVSRSGAAINYVYVDSLTSYSTGNGALPIIQRNTDGAAIDLKGNYITVQNVELKGLPPSTTTCTYNGVTETIAVGHVDGVDIETNAFNNVVQNVTASGFYAAVWIKTGSSYNQIFNNYFHDNLMLSSGLTAGAFGVLVHGNNNEIAFNQIDGSDACSPAYGRDGSAVEVYGSSSGAPGASNNAVHHNKAKNDDAFVELGKASSSVSSNNSFAYNQYLYDSTHNHGIFLVTRGASDSYGPVLSTSLYNNTAYITGNYKQGVVCYAGCDATVMKARNNIMFKGIYADQAAVVSNNLSSNPGFVNPTAGDFSLTSGASAAIDKGSSDNGG